MATMPPRPLTPDEARSLPITPANLREMANRPCHGERTVILRRTADEVEHLLRFVIQKCPECGAVAAPSEGGLIALATTPLRSNGHIGQFCEQVKGGAVQHLFWMLRHPIYAMKWHLHIGINNAR